VFAPPGTPGTNLSDLDRRDAGGGTSVTIGTTGTTDTTPTPGPGSRQRLGTYATYEEAQRVVDRLSDAGFPVPGVQIVGSGLRTVEQVTGRLTTGRAALLGAGAGAW
jgi:hypothetical protein